jgi:hypothetical protein
MLKSAFATALFSCSVHHPAYSVELSKQEICSFVASSKAVAVLLNESRDKILTDFQVGEFDFSDKSKWNDLIPSAKKFRLIVRPANIHLKDECSLSSCVAKVEVKPICPNSREYFVTLQLNPRKFGPGPFESEFDLRLFDKKTELPVEASMKLNFAQKMVGFFYMPTASIIQRPETSNKISQLLKGTEAKVDLELINNGNRTLNLGKWDKMDLSEGTIALDSTECQNITLAPGALCKLSLSNPSKRPVTETYHYWFNHYYKEDANISLYLTPRWNGSIDYNVKND